MSDDLHELVPKVARNEIFYFIARGCMIFATTVGLPVAGYLMQRLDAKADEIAKTLIVLNVEAVKLRGEVETTNRFSARQLDDHEGRIRGLERSNDRGGR